MIFKTLIIAATLGVATLGMGQSMQPKSGPTPASPTSGLALIQKLDSPVPLNVPFKDEAGRDVMLGDYFGDKPIILMLVFYKCAGTCALEFESMAATLRAFKKEKVGKEASKLLPPAPVSKNGRAITGTPLLVEFEPTKTLFETGAR